MLCSEKVDRNGVCVSGLGNARAHARANTCSILRPLLWVGSSKTRPNKRLPGFAPQGALFSGWVSASALLSKSITERHTAPQDSTFAPSPWGSKVGCRFLSPCFALPLQNNTQPSGVCCPSQGLGQQFLFHLIYLFFSLKLFCFPKAMHTPVSQEAGSKLPGLPFRVLAVVNNASLCHPSHERPEPRSGRHQPGGLFRLFQQRLFDHPHLKLSKFILNAPLL